MAIIPHTVDIVVADMKKTLTFYKALGLEAPMEAADEGQVQISTQGGFTIGLLTEAMMREHYPDWLTPVGQRITFACRCDSPQELDATYQRLTGLGYHGIKAPWDSFWGQRYAFIADPDGNRVDLFAAISEAGEA
jgi:catechol 2,3-dioxygenase-like lactoylglutathione lyase family enzyme